MPLDLPAAPGFVRSSFGLEAHTQTFTSPLTRNTQRVVLAGARWVATYTLPRMHRRQAAAWQAFLLQCEGMANTFHAYDPDATTPRGAWTGTPLVTGAGQTGSTLTIDGCAPTVAGWGRAGDYFSWAGGELKMLTQDANTNGSGQTTLAFKPAIRTGPADNAALLFTKPTCAMILSDDRQGVWECDHNGVYQEKTFTAYEVF